MKAAKNSVAIVLPIIKNNENQKYTVLIMYGISLKHKNIKYELQKMAQWAMCVWLNTETLISYFAVTSRDYEGWDQKDHVFHL